MATCTVPEGYQCTLTQINSVGDIWWMVAFSAMVVLIAFASVLWVWLDRRR